MAKKIFWTIIRGFFSFIFLGTSFMMIKNLKNDFLLQSVEENIGVIVGILFMVYFGIICLRGALENSKVFYKKKINPFRKLNFNGWKE